MTNSDVAGRFSISNLPKSFIKFLEDNEIDPSVYCVNNLPRYIRLTGPLQQQLTLKELHEQFNGPVLPVDGIDNFFRIDAKEKIVDCQTYKDGKIFGMDLSSGMAVYSLDIKPDDHILDLCCAPGAKLCMIADLLANQGGIGTVTGVDISNHRASICKNLLKKYKVNRARIFVADGTQFSVMAPSYLEPLKRLVEANNRKNDANKKEEQRQQTKKYNNDERLETELMDSRKSDVKRSPIIRPFWAPQILRSDPQIINEKYLYDKVIVDAECTHDGSIAHILKYEKWGWDAFEKNFMNPDRINNLWDLQRKLIINAWNLLKTGGILVYSTCSLSRKQNEDVIGWFLSEHMNDAILEPIPSIGTLKTAPLRNNNNIDISNAVRFDPLISNTSGFFVARIRKQ
ncbi:7694_t:CDS:2 [Ambispora leptoticha]|uniref:7694_t:CDS:1 n=1 Tax=Ambispora leptoticha TaxID=144679 RepID=A0A9N8WIY5_9GLOM|nr:7694_t:CDS:2 [Ambispora leptoticha]